MSFENIRRSKEVPSSVLRDSNVQPTSRFEEITEDSTCDDDTGKVVAPASSKSSHGAVTSLASLASSMLISAEDKMLVVQQSSSFITRFPEEIHLYWIEFLPKTDLLSLSTTCEFFRGLSCIILYRDVKIPQDSSIDRLRLLAIARSSNKVASRRVQSLELDACTSDVVCRPVLLAISSLPALRRIEFDGDLLSYHLLTTIRSHPSITLLILNTAPSRRCLPPRLDNPSSPSRVRPPLDVHLSLPNPNGDDPEFELDLLTYFKSVNIVVRKLTGFYSELLSAVCLPLVPEVESLVLIISTYWDRNQIGKVLAESSRICQQYPSLKNVTTRIAFGRDPVVLDVFHFTDFSLATLKYGSNLPGAIESAQFVQAWKDMTLLYLEVTQDLQGNGVSLELCLCSWADFSTFTPDMVVSLARSYESATSIAFVRSPNNSAGPTFSDWEATAPLFGRFPSLKRIELFGSLTSIPNIRGVHLSCEWCDDYERINWVSPTLERNMELVGGPGGLRRIEARINRRRLEDLARHLPESTEVVWRTPWPVKRQLFVVRCGRDGVKRLVLERELKLRWQDEDEREDQECVRCRGNFVNSTFTDRLAVLSVDEVRSELALEGLDLDAFEAGPITGDETPFECFLLSMDPWGAETDSENTDSEWSLGLTGSRNDSDDETNHEDHHENVSDV